MSETPLTLDEQLKQLEIEKLRAEIAQAQTPQRFFERNWPSLVTAFAAILAACGGLAALVTAASQTFDLWTHIGQQQELVSFQQKENDARQASLEADDKRITAEETSAKIGAKLDEESKALAAKQVEIQQIENQLHHERTTVIPDWITKLQTERAAEQQQIADLQKQIAALPKSAALKTQVNAFAQTLAKKTWQAPRHGLVYLQYTEPTSLAALQGLQTEFNTDGYSVPGIEKVPAGLLNPKQKNEVRYFKEVDKNRALQVAGIANTYLNKACPGHGAVQPQLHYVDSAQASAPLELWISFGCAPVKS
jgi:hypothetical protein